MNQLSFNEIKYHRVMYSARFDWSTFNKRITKIALLSSVEELFKNLNNLNGVKITPVLKVVSFGFFILGILTCFLIGIPSPLIQDNILIIVCVFSFFFFFSGFVMLIEFIIIILVIKKKKEIIFMQKSKFSPSILKTCEPEDTDLLLYIFGIQDFVIVVVFVEPSILPQQNQQLYFLNQTSVSFEEFEEENIAESGIKLMSENQNGSSFGNLHSLNNNSFLSKTESIEEIEVELKEDENGNELPNFEGNQRLNIFEAIRRIQSQDIVINDGNENADENFDF